jgi:hypothetical protein
MKFLLHKDRKEKWKKPTPKQHFCKPLKPTLEQSLQKSGICF